MPRNLAYPTISGAAVILTVVFCVYLVARTARGHGGAAHAALAAALACTAMVELCDLLALLGPEGVGPWRQAAVVAEGAMCPAWLLFTVLFARRYEERSMPWTQRGMVLAGCLMPLFGAYLAVRGYYYAPNFDSEPILFLHGGAFYFYLGVVLCSVLALFNLEGTLAGATHHRRWKIKFVLLGAVAVLGTQVLYYSQGLLNRSLNLGLAPARSLALLLGVGLMWYSLARRGGEVKISFSRRLTYKSLVLAAAGIYLVVLGLAGEGARQLGESLSPVVLLSIGIVAGLALLVVSLSETVQRKVKVFLQRHFYQEKYDYRQQWMQFTKRLHAARTVHELHQTVLGAWCETFGLEGAAMFLHRQADNRFACVSALEILQPEVRFAPDSPLVRALRRTGGTVDVRGGLAGEGGEAASYLEASGATFAVPLTREGELDGFVLMGPTINKAESYDLEDFELMDTMAGHVASALLNMRLSDQLAKAREMEVMGKVSTFVAHDLKNLVYTLSLVVENAGKYIADPDFQKDMLGSLDSTVGKMKVLISRLKGLPERHTLKREPVRLLTAAREVAGLVPGERLRLNGDDVCAEVDREEFSKVILNLCLNAVEASTDGGEVRVETGSDGGPYLRVEDSGRGMEESFLSEAIFQPFQTTKKGGMGIGLYQCKQIVEAHGGCIEVSSAPGEGTVFVVRLPEHALCRGGDEAESQRFSQGSA
ncbi:XrtA/PEP-CTERM system histidine kinase PrsK [Desulfohalovibrio reitneri]|uniref:XrtA/PEP-CTERM system histidine kinase PrsK n=1 Tax=Desulfohalovibrio reitneri TaxID=1307759 RepID=UPI0009DEE985|nr:XrtA/PEP-CTERM system histidine kinase PrsK [Desulfohalovibrio reitneri]